ncbi:MAG TPA: S1/P1 nuclease [Candidatus Acidoferrales bacterium]
MKGNWPALAGLMLVVGVGLAPSAWGWGCTGHQVVAVLAEEHLNPHARDMVAQILAAGPIDPALRRFCGANTLDAFADSSTWADDQRSIQPDTAGWHFIDIPRGAAKGDIAPYCPPSTSCITRAIEDQLAILRNINASAQARADALRYVIHFFGDLHQPLHATSNNDLGGNCVPVTFFGAAPQEKNVAKESYAPNLHGVWDTDMVERFAHGQTPQQFANELGIRFKAQIPAWLRERIDVVSWAWASHQLAEDSVYGALPRKVAIETPVEVSACSDDQHISTRMLNLNEQIGADYHASAEGVIQEQLTKAGIRLAAALNALWQ